MSRFELAQVNIALLRAPLDSPVLADFVANLEPVNALADGTPGFVWRLIGEGNDATSVQGFAADATASGVIVNLSVWSSVQALADFVFNGLHIEVMRRRREWFERMETAYAALWWVPAGERPTVSEAERRVAHLRSHGPTPTAFTLARPFPGPAAYLRSQSARSARPDRATTGGARLTRERSGSASL